MPEGARALFLLSEVRGFEGPTEEPYLAGEIAGVFLSVPLFRRWELGTGGNGRPVSGVIPVGFRGFSTASRQSGAQAVRTHELRHAPTSLGTPRPASLQRCGLSGGDSGRRRFSSPLGVLGAASSASRNGTADGIRHAFLQGFRWFGASVPSLSLVGVVRKSPRKDKVQRPFAQSPPPANTSVLSRVDALKESFQCPLHG